MKIGRGWVLALAWLLGWGLEAGATQQDLSRPVLAFYGGLGRRPSPEEMAQGVHAVSQMLRQGRSLAQVERAVAWTLEHRDSILFWDSFDVILTSIQAMERPLSPPRAEAKAQPAPPEEEKRSHFFLVMVSIEPLNIAMSTLSGFAAGEAAVGVTAPVHAHFGADIARWVSVMAGFSLMHTSFTSKGAGGIFTAEREDSQLTIAFDVAVRVFFMRMEAKKAMPYVTAAFFTSFTTVDAPEDDTLAGMEDQLDPTGFSVALGGEYLFTDHFGMGAEIGFRFAGIFADDNELTVTSTFVAATTCFHF